MKSAKKKSKQVVAKKSKKAAKKSSKTAAAKKNKTAVKNTPEKAAKKKITASAKKRVKPTTAKKAKRAMPAKARKVSAAKAKTPAKKKITATKRLDNRVKDNRKKSFEPEVKKPVTEKSNKAVQESSLPEVITHGENLHFIPEHEGMHPVTTFESHQIENDIRHREAVALRQENQKVKNALAGQKSTKRFNRVR